MKKDLNHLTSSQQIELGQIKNLIKVCTNVEMIILFGSYARGDYVEYDETIMPGTKRKEVFQSDYDILVVLENKKKADAFLDKKTKIESLIYDKIKEGEIRTPVSIIYDEINFINLKITEYNSFYCDIKKEGILLYDSKRCEITNSYNLTSKEKKEIAGKEFEHWWGKAKISLKGFHFYLDYSRNENSENSRQYLNEAAFNLHQATERLYNAILFVFTFYTPKTHDLKKLSASVNPIDKGLPKIFPLHTKKWSKRSIKCSLVSAYQQFILATLFLRHFQA